MDTKGNTGAIIAGIVLAVVLIGGWFVTARERAMVAGNYQPAATSSTSTEAQQIDGSYDTVSGNTGGAQNAAPANQATVAEGDSISISSQPAGMSVAVASVTLSQSGWIAIRDNTGRTLGAALFPAGTQSNVSVPLLRTTSPGQRYQALLYFDDGTKTFDLHTETLVENTDGSVAGTMFSVQ